MKSQLNRLVLAWLLLGLLGAVFSSIVAFSMTLFMKTAADAWIIGGFAFLGFLPGLLGACSQRFAGIAGFIGLIIGLLWGIVESISKKGMIWPIFVYFCILQAYFLALAIGLFVQIFIKPRPLPANKPQKRKTKPMVLSIRPKPIKPLQAVKSKKIKNAQESRFYEV